MTTNTHGNDDCTENRGQPVIYLFAEARSSTSRLWTYEVLHDDKAPKDHDWKAVVSAFVDGWKTEYEAANTK